MVAARLGVFGVTGICASDPLVVMGWEIDGIPLGAV